MVVLTSKPLSSQMWCYLLQGRESALLLLLQSFDLLEQTASLQTQPSNLFKHLKLLILWLTQTTTKK